jgi:hypothetical protein
MKRIFIVSILTCVLLIPLAPGCTPSQENNGTQSQTLITPTPLISVEVSFQDDAPSLNQTAELLCIVITHRVSAKNMSINVELPDAFELVSGELSWTGDVSADSEATVIRALVKSVQVGNWTIDTRSQMDPQENSGYGGGDYPIYVSVLEDSAEWGITPPWFKGHTTIPPTQEIE